MVMTYTGNDVIALLKEVADPEIPVLSVVDLGIIEKVCVDGNRLYLGILPTYNGCPAIDLIRLMIHEKCYDAGFRDIEIEYLKTPHWTTDRISPEGMNSLREYGIAAPDKSTRIDQLIHGISTIRCPKCDSSHTFLISAFGSTPCKALMQCKDCHEPFEYFKCNGIPND
ncbi:MAG TPA: phenylacetate-CoA oxygenase subunit PaaJ [Saprospiraceae bacterium]|jgi:ring-1,2-phenylacetyl-CoA epoxidase subunit PaaD|nr:phenylacetate-CoA oxygenase subunit PaaJ [Candidatus Parvibacillus calidus]QLH30084.1 MAG: phenylacetate-CoA oxygenase subunit PaaJ [Candidatus Parvibacillus calidus]HRN33577.1 phenylacetate-CoA oxygenase subunit PaaJ [Saprospiraceae bacterium]HRP83910.1 phenylacetate-CoA oxygenase subunit PaaJ [Saprospiraceae bacterium]